MWGERGACFHRRPGPFIRLAGEWSVRAAVPARTASLGRSVIAVIHHLEKPFLGHAAAALGPELDERRLRDGDPLPRLGEVDGIVSLGGEQNALDPELAEEAALLREAVERRVPVLGVCLGAQLLAHALGGTVRRLPRRHVAWLELCPTAAAVGDPVLGALPPGARGVHWNEDGFDPPPGAVELLRSPAGSGEGFRFGETAWGVQFHPELDAPALEHWYRDWQYALDEAEVSEEAARAADARHMRGQPGLAAAIFGGFVATVNAHG